ncbi:MAG: hypothetical protein QOI89_2482 [Solirubrobacteraceae bacterium]|jgi:hypothetical protein|nr:hypothetical protein [Solirubrobacteraceae bacterium]
MTGMQALTMVEAKDGEIAAVRARLAALEEDRKQAALAGNDTRELRRQIADAEADVEDLRVQAERLSRELEEATDLELHRKRHALLAGIHRTDVEYLRARRLVMEKLHEVGVAKSAMRALLDAIGERTGRTPGSEIGYIRLREPTREHLALGLGPDPKDVCPIMPLGGVMSDGGDTLEEVNADIERVEQLAAEAEREADSFAAPPVTL